MLGHGPIRARRPLRRRNSRRRSARRGAGRLAAAAIAPARRAALRADQPTVATSVSVLGATADNTRCWRVRRGFPRRRRPRPARPNSCAKIRRSPARCASAWLLRAAAACAALARHREDSSALRDAEHLSPNAGGNAPTSPAGRIHRLWRLFALRPIAARRADDTNRRRSARPRGRRQLRGVRRRLAGRRGRRRNIRSRRPRARAPRR